MYGSVWDLLFRCFFVSFLYIHLDLYILVHLASYSLLIFRHYYVLGKSVSAISYIRRATLDRNGLLTLNLCRSTKMHQTDFCCNYCGIKLLPNEIVQRQKTWENKYLWIERKKKKIFNKKKHFLRISGVKVNQTGLSYDFIGLFASQLIIISYFWNWK